ncbi:MAG: FAD-linked oxidase C-terminal domain-containing protein [Bacteroidota bacterium]
MKHADIQQRFLILEKQLEGDLFLDESSLLMYSTDASAYKEKPLAVCRSKNAGDIGKLINFAAENGVSLIPRAAGTSLAGQVVGKGIVVDVSKHMGRILEINETECWVRVEPGVVPDELNKVLEPLGLFFGPETSTSNRCMIGGMVGNNSCGAHSILYGSTRDHTLEVKGYLSDGAFVTFGALSKAEYAQKLQLPGLEGDVYRNVHEILSDVLNQAEIRTQYPHPEIERRNTGYALDLLLETNIFTEGSPDFNFCKLIAGSEGTLVFMTEIKLNLVSLPPKEKGLVAVHCRSLEEAFLGNLVALTFNPASIELIDRILIECTKDNIEQRRNRFFIEGEPEAVLVIEFAKDSRQEVLDLASAVEKAMREAGYGYHFPLILNQDMNKVWALRKAGLGLLSNVPGDAKPVTLIEDTAVRPVDLPAYMKEFREILLRHGKDCVYYAHIATGELHLKPVLNLKDPEDLRIFRALGREIAVLVKKYRGSLSGEHGDGRLRGEFIPLMLGDHVYQLLRKLKMTWDPNLIFNPGKITDAPPMDEHLRFESGQQERVIKTYFDFSKEKGLLKAVEKCNGSGDCRKSEIIGGTMCPSFQASRNENQTTRARANILREFLTNSKKENPFDHQEIYDVLDLCLSCKACKSECPSNVDVAKYKAEFLQHYHDTHGIPLRTLLIANISKVNKLGMLIPGLFNFFISSSLFAGITKAVLGIAPARSIPKIYQYSLTSWFEREKNKLSIVGNTKGKVYLFVDEFTEYNDVVIGQKAIKLLFALGYEVEIPKHLESGRAYISKGLLKKAKVIANRNVELLGNVITVVSPLLGIEPSAILTFRDEYPELVSEGNVAVSRELAKNALMLDEFLASEMEKGRIKASDFTEEPLEIWVHGHCQQKSVASATPMIQMIGFPENYTVKELKTGCCGMAGSFGYEKEHYNLSMQVGEMLLFPSVRQAPEAVMIAAPGTSCRHQIHDGTGRKALHPIEILYSALKIN